MSAGLIAGWAIVAVLALAPGAQATTPSVAQQEASYLIGVVETSGCTFYRNGSWYDAARAAAHLREKYALVDTGGAIATGEQFIEKVATRSAFTGVAYEVDCPGHGRQALAAWLNDALARHRATKGASRDSRDAP